MKCKVQSVIALEGKQSIKQYVLNINNDVRKKCKLDKAVIKKNETKLMMTPETKIVAHIHL